MKLSSLHSKAVMMLLSAVDKNTIIIRRIAAYLHTHIYIACTCTDKRLTVKGTCKARHSK